MNAYRTYDYTRLLDICDIYVCIYLISFPIYPFSSKSSQRFLNQWN